MSLLVLRQFDMPSFSGSLCMSLLVFEEFPESMGSALYNTHVGLL